MAYQQPGYVEIETGSRPLFGFLSFIHIRLLWEQRCGLQCMEE